LLLDKKEDYSGLLLLIEMDFGTSDLVGTDLVCPTDLKSKITTPLCLRQMVSIIFLSGYEKYMTYLERLEAALDKLLKFVAKLLSFKILRQQMSR